MDEDNITDKYILVGREPVPEPDTLKWGKWFETADRIVRRDEIDGVTISTVFLGLDHAFGGGVPLLFETMIFGGEHDGYQTRAHTWDEAVAQHIKAKRMVVENGSK